MKTTTRYYFAKAIVVFLCMTLISANAAVDKKTDRSFTASLNEEAIISKVIQPGAFPDQAAHDQTGASSSSVAMFKLPATLQVVGDEAFEGTAIVVVKFPETLEIIGERAFANISVLRSAFIPERTSYIGKNAFDGSDGVTISASYGSYARAWAKKHGVAFEPVTMLCAGALDMAVQVNARSTRQDIETTKNGTEAGIEVLQTWRIREIKAAYYEEQIGHQVQGRSPPAWV